MVGRCLSVILPGYKAPADDIATLGYKDVVEVARLFKLAGRFPVVPGGNQAADTIRRSRPAVLKAAVHEDVVCRTVLYGVEISGYHKRNVACNLPNLLEQKLSAFLAGLFALVVEVCVEAVVLLSAALVEETGPHAEA